MIRAVTQLHEHPQLISVAQSLPGRLALLGLAALLVGAIAFWQDQGAAALTMVGVVLATLMPQQRRLLLSVTSLAMLGALALAREGIVLDAQSMGQQTTGLAQWGSAFVKCLAVVALLYLCFLVARHLDRMPAAIRQHPVAAFHAGLLSGLLVIGNVPVFAILAGELALIPFLAWRVSYMLAAGQRGKTAGTQFKDHLFYLWPAFGGAQLPMGKGFDYLSRNEATDAETLARSQLAGLKLLILAISWSVLADLMYVVVFGEPDRHLAPWAQQWNLGIPLLTEAMRPSAAPGLGLSWLTVFVELLRLTLNTCIFGHVVVGCLRLMGFNVFRNTYRPLLAESLIDFWHRFAHYFKELCVDFFFYPVYLRCGWAGPRLRLFLAVFAAAFLGNMYYHVLTEPERLIAPDLAALWAHWNSRLLYGLLLAIGVWLSMLRQQSQRAGTRAASSPLLRLRRIFGVWVFFGVIHIFNVSSAHLTFRDRMAFALGLVGL